MATGTDSDYTKRVAIELSSLRRFAPYTPSSPRASPHIVLFNVIIAAIKLNNSTLENVAA